MSFYFVFRHRHIPMAPTTSTQKIQLAIFNYTGMAPSQYYFTQRGRAVSLSDLSSVCLDVPIYIVKRTSAPTDRSGLAKTTVKETCCKCANQDLSGRQRRTTNE
ncbi:uncharacterized protein LOC125767108 [Anopheles funestus]|uniref:uncharacterized protein LOC125767108 n=1 Tax=Anopheles funestus TaxID=62324 RepID=UPI0020C6420B|nr:uncharacterized protein LOC125767108 [Anopheles funestus]